MIGEPPLSAGAAQEMMTLVFPFTEVAGEAGAPGTAAALMTTSDESELKPNEFRALTLNVYTTSAVRVEEV